MKNIQVCLDKKQYSTKPPATDAAQISPRLARQVETLNTNSDIKEFAFAVAEKGQTFCPTTFADNSRKADSFKQMQFSGLDFDGGISFSEVKSRADKYGLPILFAYDTFSSKEHNKFRVLFLNDTPITDIKAAKITQNALVTIFPEADKCSKDVAHMYYGGNELLHFDESIPTINIESLTRNMSYYLKEKYGNTNYKRKISEFAKANNIRLNEKKLLDISIINPTEDVGTSSYDSNNKISPSSILLPIIVNGEILLNYQINIDKKECTNPSSVVQKVPINHNSYRSSMLNDIRKCCKLFREFENGDKRLAHEELYGVALNLIQIETGSNFFQEILGTYSDYDEQNRWDYYLRYFKQNNYKPQNCNGFCPYKNQCNHSTNILSTANPKRHLMNRIVNYTEEYYPIKEVEEDVYKKIKAAVNSEDNNWHIIKAQTAIGKTEAFLRIMKKSSKKFLVAVPTNILKNDIYERARSMGINVIMSPSLDEIKDEIPDYIWNYIVTLRKSGRHKFVTPYIYEELKSCKIPCLIKYLEDLEKFENSACNAIVTHKRFLGLNEETLSKYDEIIIDEDIIFKAGLPNQGSITVSELKEIKRECSNDRLTKKIRTALKRAYKENETLFTLKSVKCKINSEDDGISTAIDIPSFCLAQHFYFCKSTTENGLKEDTFIFLKPIKFTNRKHIMVSATVDKTICEYYFGADKVKFCECKKAKYKGTLNQYHDKSMSRACIAGNLGIIERIRAWTGNENLITFMKYSSGELHFGNTEGYNQWKGKNIDVIGTPYHAEFLYKLFAYSIGLEFEIDAKVNPNYIATYNGYRFRFTTYEDEVLRNIQFWMLESELEQAVGRARLLREDCTVNLFSTFPLKQAVMGGAGY